MDIKFVHLSAGSKYTLHAMKSSEADLQGLVNSAILGKSVTLELLEGISLKSRQKKESRETVQIQPSFEY